ncbi:SMP-30/gluconolactonase/LRE family protein [Xanthomonas theicola]|uniref:SMP-30/Gluconolactonase/LRE-like region domain-containing protein n=1 Tax=Xanthomonas theicola TaxID=56464 RepID=A0A2S6ZHD9_9XANT|nr:SMP-30/gluconolactonase/LRE family protein [Xanthomonas theicola]PPT91694.1 hypothetical protein XthCFBP4691_06575 [Xanthomonas theicola]QNH26037.1 SMP-30/gluconolactonase/LRE family protein [Xanthomonas theicola]
MRFNGVYRLDTDGSVHLPDDGLCFPNGIALSPDERTLLRGQLRPGTAGVDRVCAPRARRGRRQARLRRCLRPRRRRRSRLPDGMAVAPDGRVLATGPGGARVSAPDGRRLGRIETDDAVFNCAFGDDGRTLCMTSHTLLARMRVWARGLGFAP